MRSAGPCVKRERALPAHARAMTVKSLIFDPRPKTGAFNRFAEGRGKQKESERRETNGASCHSNVGSGLNGLRLWQIPA